MSANLLDTNRVLAELLDVVDAACKTAEIPYVLWGRTALGAYNGNGFTLGFDGEAEIVIHLKDARRLEQILNGLYPDKYRCISWMSCAGYPELTMRFMDLRTSRINFNYYGVLPVQGMEVRIHCLRPSSSSGLDEATLEKMKALKAAIPVQGVEDRVRGLKPSLSKGLGKVSKTKMKALKALEMAQHEGSVTGKRTLEAAAAQLSVVPNVDGAKRFQSIESQETKPNAVLERIAEEWLKFEGEDDRLMHWSPATRKPKYFDADLLTNVVSCGEHDWLIPADIDSFLTKTVRSNWRSFENVAFSDSPNMWLSTDVPYKKVVESGAIDPDDLGNAFAARLMYLEKRVQFKDTTDELTRYRRRIKVLGAARELEKTYCGDTRDEIIRAYMEKDTAKLDELFADYKGKLDIVKTQYHGCVLLDPLLNEIFKELLVANGETGLCKYIKDNQKKATAGRRLVVQLPLKHYQEGEGDTSFFI